MLTKIDDTKEKTKKALNKHKLNIGTNYDVYHNIFRNKIILNKYLITYDLLG